MKGSSTGPGSSGPSRTAPGVSVIIPTHNLAHLLPRAIEGVVAQTFTDWELVIVDDASDDDTEAVVRSYLSDPRIRYLRLDRNSGPSAARNAGIARTSGKLVAFLDGDDLWLPTKLEKQVDSLEDERFGVSGIAAYNDFPGPRSVPRGKRSPFEGDGLYLELLFDNTIPGSASALVVRRSCLDAVGGWDEALRGGEDRDLWLRLALLYPFVFVDEPLVHIDRTRDDRATRNWTLMASNREVYLRKRERDVPGRFRGCLPELRRQNYLFMAKCYLKAGDVGRGRRYAVRAATAGRSVDREFWNACALLVKSFVRSPEHVMSVPRGSNL